VSNSKARLTASRAIVVIDLTEPVNELDLIDSTNKPTPSSATIGPLGPSRSPLPIPTPLLPLSPYYRPNVPSDYKELIK
jgi:hypothetical protein